MSGTGILISFSLVLLLVRVVVYLFSRSGGYEYYKFWEYVKPAKKEKEKKSSGIWSEERQDFHKWVYVFTMSFCLLVSIFLIKHSHYEHEQEKSALMKELAAAERENISLKKILKMKVRR